MQKEKSEDALRCYLWNGKVLAALSFERVCPEESEADCTEMSDFLESYSDEICRSKDTSAL